MNLSPHFTLAEMIRSSTASRRGIDNTPSPTIIENLRRLCEHVLEPVRSHYKRPVIVTSGYRSPALNSAIGGSGTSQHSQGEAADFTVHGVSNLEVCRWMEKTLTYDQLIYEFGEDGWIHASWSAKRLRNMELTARRVNGRTVYLAGLLP
ncbi:MAG: hypothetical protein B7Y36_08180 [Novosphingobium sp. 28-62-57]|uniref:D-Ala-D-Ala carboxypeptidase family metallohydrolase n=1 Tax=unclassified Novosphingobium TaxID=2644732 RepID=UPI000BCF31AA|nr:MULTISPECIES: D-Ala-D-Ala carboxypeptidase family metallohydrolase [unclassified Novosphingobium]OYW47902.1 MAG: hypothetical protein B7Z36_01275 [Novosphingobium sp. 12-63-9]OYZ10793.1 MAG: hypothetical protein B7Y36_08180 [Novosphingobium sp. 28-62-57]OZA31206.1 MAG: hypothetical protein B7X92_15115 [Novosphingobium sp. 17-62-9]HQS70902.1 D-Ala-D-Ala carboxypeptidase family metallohydrolase [Novosphingobium sp.]